MNKFLQQIILPFPLTLILFIFPLYSLLGINNPGKDEALQKKVNNWMEQSALGFEENKGQFADNKGNPVPDLLFKTSAIGMDLYVTTRGISYIFTKSEKVKKNSGVEDRINPEEEPIRVQRSRLDMDLRGATIKRENIVMEYPLEQGNLNYYLGHCPKGILNVQTYRKITIKSIYTGIDWVLYANGSEGLKYDFIVHPGADPKMIKMCYKGAETIEKSDDETLKITTRLGEIKEGKLLSFEEESRKEVKSSYQLYSTANSTEVSFDISKYDLNQNLIIDPPLLWATYYGGVSSDGALDITTDPSGNVYVTGHVTKHKIPLDSLPGAYYQDTTDGASPWNAYILKFNSSGVRQWATLYGGNGTDFSQGIVTDNMGNVYLTGGTNSSDFPLEDAGGSAYFQNFAGVNDAFILKFNPAGIRIWATLYGGTGSENTGKEYHRIAIDPLGNIYITGHTEGNLPLANPGGGAYSQPYQGGITLGSAGDAFIAKFDSSLTLVWATYFGGHEGFEMGTAITTDIFGNVFITGRTTSSDFPVYSSGGAYSQILYGGVQDAFILKFNTIGVLLWSAYYGGIGSDFGTDIATDLSGNIYVTGGTFSTDFPTYNEVAGAYFQFIGGAAIEFFDAFVLKFDNEGIRKWATYYGGVLIGNDVGYSITVHNQDIYITGSAYSNDFPLYNQGECSYFNDTIKGVFIIQFDTSGILKWATRYTPGTGYGIATDKEGFLYIVGETGGFIVPMTTLNPGGGAYYQSTHSGGSTQESFILKFAPSFKAVFDHTTACLKDTTFFTDESRGIIDFWSWDFDDPASGAANNSNEQNPKHIFSAPGVYNVKLVIAGCDSVIIPVTVYPLPLADAGDNVAICIGDSISLSASGGIAYIWTPSSGLNTDTVSTVKASPSSTSTYIVTVTDTNGCVNKDSVTVTVNPLPVANTSSDASICIGDSTTLTASGGVSYNWSPSAGLNVATGSSVNASPAVITIYTVTATDANGCINEDSILVTVNPLPNANAGPDVTLCPGVSAPLTALGGISYTWSPSEGLSATTGNSVNANPASTTTYTVTVTDINGCIGTDTVIVTRLVATTATTSSTPANCGSNDGSGTVTPDGVNAPYAYSWFPGGQTTATSSNLSAGIYICTVTDVGGCTYDFNVTVDNVNGFSGSLISQNNVSCSGESNGSATVAGSGGTSPYSYTWSTNPVQNGATVSGIAAGFYSCTISDADNCTYLVSMNITEPAPLLLSTSSTADVCRTSNGSASVTVSGGTPAYSYSWDLSPSVDPDISNLSAGNYVVTVTDNNGCTTTASINVPVAGSLILNIAQVTQSGCNGTCSGSIEVTATGTEPYSFLWNTSPPQTTSNATGLCPGDYTLIATDADNCRDSLTVTITENLPFTVSFTAEPKQGCAPLCVSFNNTTPNTSIASWQFGNGQSDTGSAVSNCYTEAGNYSITLNIRDNFGCTEAITMQDFIQVYPSPVADFSMIPTHGSSLTNALIRFTDKSIGADQWLWNFGDPLNSESSIQNPTFTYNNPGNYTVNLLVSNKDNCTDTVSHTIYIEPEFTVYIPNAFTPDGDGLNDSFAPHGVEFTEFEMVIFNRWGEMIYQTMNIDKPWDGKSKSGNKIQEGVYVYKIWVKDFKEQIHYYVGNVTLIK